MPGSTAVTEVVQRTDAPVRRPGLVLAVIVTCQLMLMLDTTVMNVVLPRIQAQLRFSAIGLSWVMSAYTLVFGGLLLLGGRAGDLLGRRRVFIAGVAVFTVASCAGGLSGSPGWLILARAAQGLGAAAAGPSALALLATTFTEPRARVRAFSVYTGVGSSGIVLGLVLGGLLTQLTSWRCVLFINVPVGVAVIVLAARFIAESPRVRAGLDLPGAVTGTVGLAAIVYGLTSTASSGASSGARHAPAIGALVAGALLIAGFVAVERRAATPLIPPRLFASWNRAVGYLNFFLGTTTLAVLFFLTQFLQNIRHVSALATGLAFLPLALMLFAMTRLLPLLVQRFGARTLVVAGSAATMAGMLCLTRLTPDSGYPGGLLVPLVLIGAGMGLGLAPLNVVIMATVRPADAGAAGGVLQSMQQVGGAFGLAVFITIFGLAGASAAAHGADAPHATVTGITHVALASALVAACALATALTLRSE
jgi:EmrB/QacA subfamily drug resistance transporter